MCLTLSLTVGFLVVVASHTSYNCTWTAERYDASFDLCDFRLTNGTQSLYYRVHDSRATENISSYNYFFNVGTNIGQFEVESCINNTLRQSYGFPTGYCNNIYNYTCIGHITPIDQLSM